MAAHPPDLLLGASSGAHPLANEEDLRVEELRRDHRYLLSEMSTRREEAGDLSGAVSLFLKVSKSYWKGLFHC